MRRSLRLLVTLILVAGCGSDEGDDVFIRTTFDGAIWSATAADAQLSFTVDNPDDAGIWFSIASRPHGGGSQSFSLGLPDPIAEGSYPLNGSTDYAPYLSCPDDVFADCISWRVVPSHPGTLTITGIDTETGLVRGTFSFNGYLLGDSTASHKAFTGGAFVIRVPALIAPGPATSSR